MEQKDTLELIKQLSRIATALEEQNKLKKRELQLEKKRYNRDYDIVTESEDSQTKTDGQKKEEV